MRGGIDESMFGIIVIIITLGWTLLESERPMGQQSGVIILKLLSMRDRSPGLVVMGGDRHSGGCEFGSQYCILDGYLYTLYCSKNCNVCVKRPKINQK